MAGKISELGSAAALGDTDTLEVVQSGTNKKATGAQVGVLARAAASFGLYQAETLAWLERCKALGADPGRTADGVRVIDLIDEYIWGLKADGVWAKLGARYIYAMPTSALALINIVNPGTLDMAASGGPTFTAWEGFTGDSTDAFLSAGAALSAIPNYAQDSAHLAAWITGGTDVVSNGARVISTTSSANASLIPRNASGFLAAAVNSSTVSVCGASSTILGLSMVNRSGATALEGYRDGAGIGTDTDASNSIPAGDFCVLRTASTYNDFRVAMASWGGSMTSGEAADDYARTDALLAALGASV